MRKRAKRAKTKHLWVQAPIDPPHSGRKTGRDQKTLSIFVRKKGVDHDEISFP